MLQSIKKIFPIRQAQSGKKKIRGDSFGSTKNFDGAKQLKEMGKLGGKLILM